MKPTLLLTHIYDHLLGTGRPPTVREIAAFFDVHIDAVRHTLANLKVGKTVLLEPHTGEVWMAGPFSAMPTDYRVRGSGATSFANCAWDMLGVAVIVNERVTVETHCADCGQPMIFAVDPRTGAELDAIVHFLVPARHWYDDIGFT